ncbi:transmembrane emp24 domain-containing protein p24beta2-like [Syzygium oleosum]|uniref:transmembrane emp24 domain-containing protein p24beta2-like n=1 Tax=Syzygium oleosum TaxID=219896 RepID=UPI0024BA6728|nr:transmembrane emp24 domain-containing protein p24beta2-like [Syzygium oleosum]
MVESQEAPSIFSTNSSVFLREPTRFPQTEIRSPSIILLAFASLDKPSPDLRAEVLSASVFTIHKMNSHALGYILTVVPGLFLFLHADEVKIRFMIDREECFAHDVQYEKDTVHVPFMVNKSDSAWHYSQDGVDLVVKGPSGNQIQDSHDRISEKFEFMAHRKGVHQFCFTNKSPYHETIDFDVHVGHFAYYDQHEKNEHINPLLEQIGKLEEALYNIQFEQHWLEAQAERQAIVNDAMSRRAVHKAFFESAALIGASVLQVYLLCRFFERKLDIARV